MSLILIPQISGSVLPANVHQRVVYKKPQLFIIACAFPHSRQALHGFQALAQNTPPPSRRCLKDAFTPSSGTSTVHVIAGRRRSSAQFASDCHSPVTRDGSADSVPFAPTNQRDFEISSDSPPAL